MKTCTLCKIEKDISLFRVRIDKRIKTTNKISHNNVCLECEAKRSSVNKKKLRSTPEGKAKHAKWNMSDHWRHREERLAKMKDKRSTPEYKAYMKEYRAKNKDKIYQQEAIAKKRYQGKNVNAVTDKYVVGLLVSQGYGTKDEILANRDLIEMKKIQVLTDRIKMKIIKLKKDENN